MPVILPSSDNYQPESAFGASPPRPPPDSPLDSDEPPASRTLAWLSRAALILAVLTPLVGLQAYQVQSFRVEHSVHAKLQECAEASAAQFEGWLRQRDSDSKVLAKDTTFAAQIKALLDPLPADDEELLARDHLAALWEAYAYRGVLLVTPDGKEKMALGGPFPLMSATDLALIRQTATDGKIRRTSLYFTDRGPYIDWLVPVGPAPSTAVAVLCANPEPVFPRTPRYLLNLGAHPEILLVDRTTNTYIQLNGAPTSRNTDWRPLSTTPDNLANPSRVLGIHGTEMLAAHADVPGTPWLVLSAVDRQSALAALRNKALTVTGAALMLLLSASALFTIISQKQRHVRQLSRQESDARAARTFGKFFGLPFLGMGVVDPLTNRWVQVNERLCDILGRERDELLAAGPESEVSPSALGVQPDLYLASGEHSTQARITKKNGTCSCVVLDIRYEPADSRTAAYVLVTVQDATDRKRAEARARRLAQMHEVLSECNKAIVQHASEPELLRKVCEDAVRLGGLTAAWIGLLPDSQPEGVVACVACHGAATACESFRDTRISSDPSDRYGQGPTGRALRSGQSVWCLDFLNDPTTRPWHAAARAGGWVASAALPLTRGQRVVGTLNLYASDPDVFSPDMQKLLLEMAQDVSYALEGFARDALQRAMTLALQESEAFSIGVLDSLSEHIAVLDEHGVILAVNRAWREFARDNGAFDLYRDSVGRNYLSSVSTLPEIDVTGEAATALEGIQGVLSGALPTFELKYSCHILGDGTHWFRMLVTPLRGARKGAVVAHENITEHNAALARIERLAHFDTLTGLPNRALLADRVDHDLSRAQRHNESLALLFLDLDRFKYINDSLGHKIGDELLRQVANRLQGCLRSVDTVSRLGGDEFMLVIPDVEASDVIHVVQKLLLSIATPFQVEQHELNLTASLGIAMYPADGQDYDELSRCADLAMYRAKRAGRNTYRFFTAELQTRSVRTLTLENALRKAIQLNQFSLAYQPQIALDTGNISGVEALLRWESPELGTVSPSEFIPIAEDCGMILAIGDWVLAEAARQLRAWLDAGLPPVTVAVNVSAVQFRQANLPQRIMQILESVRLPPDLIELELTEGTTMVNPTAAVKMMDRLHEHGIRLAIDDFGTGYSSLSYLKRFHVHKLKIDQSFIRNIIDDPEDRAIVRALLSLARSLEIVTLAEGVSTREQLDFLRSQGCTAVQGFYFSEPLSAGQFAMYLSAGSAEATEPFPGSGLSEPLP